jgi:hypothetical protein
MKNNIRVLRKKKGIVREKVDWESYVTNGNMEFYSRVKAKVIIATVDFCGVLKS